MIAFVGYLLLFLIAALLLVGVTLLIGRYVRPDNPNFEKQSIYECSEPAVGSSWVQFDVRYYVVALLFIKRELDRDLAARRAGRV